MRAARTLRHIRMQVAALMQSTLVRDCDEERAARERELRSLEAYRLRLEHEARVADELVRIDVLARRLSSRPPPALASIPVPAQSAPPPAMWSASQLPFGDASSGSWPALTMDVVGDGASAASPQRAMHTRLSLIAVAVTVSALLSFVGLAFVLGPCPAQAQKHAASESQATQAEPQHFPSSEPAQAAGVAPTATPHATCGTDPKPVDPPASVATAASALVAPIAPIAANAPIAKTAKRSPRAVRNASTPTPSPAATEHPPAPATREMDQAARTAQMLREQLGTTLQ